VFPFDQTTKTLPSTGSTTGYEPWSKLHASGADCLLKVFPPTQNGALPLIEIGVDQLPPFALVQCESMISDEQYPPGL